MLWVCLPHPDRHLPAVAQRPFMRPGIHCERLRGCRSSLHFSPSMYRFLCFREIGRCDLSDTSHPGEPISTRAQRKRFRTSLAIPANVRIWISSFQGQSRYSGRSNPRYAKSTNDPPPLNDLDVFTHTYVIGHLVFQVLSSRFNSILNRGRWVELPEQDHYWNPASQQIWPVQRDTVTWPTKYLGPNTIEPFVDRWFGRIPVTLITGPQVF